MVGGAEDQEGATEQLLIMVGKPCGPMVKVDGDTQWRPMVVVVVVVLRLTVLALLALIWAAMVAQDGRGG